MRITTILAFVAVVHSGSVSIAAQQRANLFAPSKPSKPTRFLFPTRTPGVQPAPKPTVVCGLTLIPVDPNVDPKIRLEVPENGPRFSTRSVDPKLCRR